MGKELLFFFSAVGTFNGLLLSLYFIFFTRKKYLTNYLIGALILALSIRIGKSVVAYFDPTLPAIYRQIGLSACFFIGPFLYLFLTAAAKGLDKMPRRWTAMLYTLLATTIIGGTLFSYSNYPALWNKYLAWIIYIQWLAFVIASAYPLRARIAKFFTKGAKRTAQDTWLLMIYFGNVIIYVVYFLALIQAPFTSYINGSIVFSFMLYLAFSVLLYRKKTDDLFQFTIEKSGNRKIEPALAKTLIEKLEKTMSGSKAFKDSDLKLSSLASMIGVPAHQLSQMLNEHIENNFTTYVNNYRIQEACSIISVNNLLTLEAIGYEVGFNSKSTFFAAFKKHTGMTPLTFMQKSAVSPKAEP